MYTYPWLNKMMRAAGTAGLLALLLSGCTEVQGKANPDGSGTAGSGITADAAAQSPAGKPVTQAPSSPAAPASSATVTTLSSAAEQSPFDDVSLSGMELTPDHTLYVWGNTSNSAFTLFQSTDGGVHWNDISPGKAKSASFSGEYALTAYDRNHLWLFSHNESGTEYSWYSKDGGRTWKQSATELKYMYSQQSVFLNKNEGYLLSETDAAMGSSGKVFYYTQNGGQTWNEVGSNLSAEGGFTPKDEQFFPAYGFTNYGLSFRDRKHGWAPLQTRDERPHVVHTKDSGKSWQEVRLPALTGVGCTPQIADAPSFFGEQQKEGWMPLQCNTDDNAKLGGYYTKDGGQSWAYRTFAQYSPRVDPTAETVVTFISLQEGWLWDGGQLLHTQNAGVTWKPAGGRTFAELLKGKPGAQLLQLAFDSAKEGWALIRNDERSWLLHTSNGGADWTVID